MRHPHFLAVNLIALAAVASAAPPTAPSTGPASRPAAELQKEMGQLQRSFFELFPKQGDLVNPDKRTANGEKGVALIKRALEVAALLEKADPERFPPVKVLKSDLLPLLALLGDAASEAEIKTMGKSAVKEEAAEGRRLLARVNWLRSGHDAAAQQKILEEYRAKAKADPNNDELAEQLMEMAGFGAASPEVTKAAQKIIIDELKGEMAKAIAEELKGRMKLTELVGKPLVIEGEAVDGTKFSTAPWKGKVVLVDFWATWCGPCLEELPSVKKAYADFHAKGLEVLGISCDREAAALKDFVAKDKDMPWPQLFDAKRNPELRWHPLAREYGIQAIPTMFLIDRKGIVRSVEAREDYMELIPKLLEEK